ncbi:hypothetical protein IQ235_13655 [Oscillatoriales cyanobacterium LEGE 11467]|uniref:Transcription factor RcaD n=1 Tax=Zarconia navalis LEGE 11467 TaxID=1828826 RepID=A0A928VXA1_9CYAN|nr:hypothetical protein [Zarconia navalis]MBE9041826.1 hypothetical protein [Zarconia navalis LEGE 11467]
METIQVKFILKLLGFSNYRASISDSKLKPNSKTSVSKCKDICRKLCDRSWVARSEDITKFKILPPGKSLLKVDLSNLPITQIELEVLKASAKKTTTPGQIKKVPADRRQETIRDLIDRGLLAAVETKIKEVWLTERGKVYLRDEFNPTGNTLSFSGKMLDNYIQFLRQSLAGEARMPQTRSTTQTTAVQPPNTDTSRPLSDEDILETIRNLDRELGTDNYLPIFHLREKLAMVSRDELDKALYRLQRNDRLEMSSLTDSSPYTQAQIGAGIPQNMGGPLFFLIDSDSKGAEFFAI